MLTSEQIQIVIEKRTYQVQFIKLDFTSPQTHVFQGDDNYGWQHIVDELTRNPFSSVQVDLGLTTSSWYDVTIDDVQMLAGAFLSYWGPDVDPPWPDAGQVIN